MYIGTNYIKPFLKREIQKQQIKAHLRYITHRPTLEGDRGARQLFGWDGDTSKNQGYQIIDTAKKGTRFWRFKISPDPKTENPEKKIDLRKLTMQVMVELQERKGNVDFIAVIHNDHSDIPHVHAIVIFKERLEVKDLKALRDVARGAALSQQKNRILVQEYLKYLRFLQYYQRPQRFVDRPIGMAGGYAAPKGRQQALACPNGMRHETVKLKSGKSWCRSCEQVLEQSAGLSL
jgi:hypothetical protein